MPDVGDIVQLSDHPDAVFPGHKAVVLSGDSAVLWVAVHTYMADFPIRVDIPRQHVTVIE